MIYKKKRDDAHSYSRSVLFDNSEFWIELKEEKSIMFPVNRENIDIWLIEITIEQQIIEQWMTLQKKLIFFKFFINTF